MGGVESMSRKLVHHALGIRISGVRQALGLKRYEFADRLGVTKATAGNYEKGQMPRADLLDRIAKLGGVTVEWLLHGTHNPKAEPRVRMSLNKQLRERIATVAADEVPDLPFRYLSRYKSHASKVVSRCLHELREYRQGLIHEYKAKLRARSRGSRIK